MGRDRAAAGRTALAVHNEIVAVDLDLHAVRPQSISRKVVINPVRNGLVMTSVRTRSEPGTINAATMGNAADDGSAGTTTGAGTSSGSPFTEILRPSPSASILTSAPKCLSSRSV